MDECSSGCVCVVLGGKVVEKVGAYWLYTYVPLHLNIASDT